MSKIKTDKKVSKNIKKLIEKYSQLELKFSALQEKYIELESLSKKQKNFDFGSVLLIFLELLL